MNISFFSKWNRTGISENLIILTVLNHILNGNLHYMCESKHIKEIRETETDK